MEQARLKMIPTALRQTERIAPHLLDHSLELQKRYEASTSPEERKNRGQFFTPPSIASFMVAMFSRFPNHVKVLDPGAGTGTLSAAICEHILHLRSPRYIELVLYETEPTVIPFLDENMTLCRSALETAGHRMTYEIRERDFLLSNAHAFQQPTLFNAQTNLAKFDAAIMNPPYFKIQKSSEYARIMSHVVHGQPNIYALFMALTAQMLKPRGELVAITPRSFCGGLYFRGFRRWFFERMSLRHIHLFESRRETFRGANVLQESVVTNTRRSGRTPANVTLSTSFGADFQQKLHTRAMPTTQVIDNTCGNMVIRIPENPHDSRIMELVEAWPQRFADHGLCVSTGPVVMFRAREFLLETTNKSSVPLLSVHNVRAFETVWPFRKNGKPTAFKVCTESLNRRLLLPTRNYVLLRRFSAKEERRRLTASCFLKANATSDYVALENHLNYVYHAERELSTNETYGLAALFNSALLDRYFRTLSGNTQVNATELRTMSFPDLKTLALIGGRIKKLRNFTMDRTENIVLDELGVNGTLERYLMELVL